MIPLREHGQCSQSGNILYSQRPDVKLFFVEMAGPYPDYAALRLPTGRKAAALPPRPGPRCRRKVDGDVKSPLPSNPEGFEGSADTLEILVTGDQDCLPGLGEGGGESPEEFLRKTGVEIVEKVLTA